MQINLDKTKYMYAGNKLPLNPTLQNLEIGTKNVEAVKEFIYLGFQINSTNDINTEIKRRIYLANKTYLGLKKHLTSSFISRSTKCKIHKTLIRPVLTFASKTWTVTKNR